MGEPKINTGLFFGSFNPVHNGHLEIAKFLLENEGLEELWFIVSPQNPLKESIELADEKHRIEMTKLAIESEPRFNVSDIEFTMPKPSYTIDTLKLLTQQHPERKFSLIIGSDNLEEFHLWKKFRQILSEYNILVYPRKKEFRNPYADEPNVKITQAPLIEISSTQIRQLLQKRRSVNSLVPEEVLRYINEHRLYNC